MLAGSAVVNMRKVWAAGSGNSDRLGDVVVAVVRR